MRGDVPLLMRIWSFEFRLVIPLVVSSFDDNESCDERWNMRKSVDKLHVHFLWTRFVKMWTWRPKFATADRRSSTLQLVMSTTVTKNSVRQVVTATGCDPLFLGVVQLQVKISLSYRRAYEWSTVKCPSLPQLHYAFSFLARILYRVVAFFIISECVPCKKPDL